MKNSIYILIIAVFAIFSCEGPVGPMGPAGYDGMDGQDGLDGEEGYTFDYENIDLVYMNNEYSDLDKYGVEISFPDGFQMLESDVVLVYLKWDNVDIDGNTYELWRAIPQSVPLNGGLLFFNYDFTMMDVSIFFETDLPENELGNFTDDWVARVVVVPALFGARTDIDYTNYEEVAAHFNLKPFNQK